MTINMIKLVSGETILAEMVHEEEMHLSIIDPVEIKTSLRNNVPVMVCNIWVPLSKVVNIFHLKQSSIILSTEVDNDMKVYYNRCIETIRESASEDRSFLFDSKEDEMSEKEIHDVIASMRQGANTAIH